MNRRHGYLGILILLLMVAGVAYAATNGYTIDWWTVDSGGGTSQGGDFVLSGTVGQHDAGEVMSGGETTITGGFWVGGLPLPSTNWVYLPMVIR